MKTEILISFLLLIFINSSCKSNNRNENKTIDSERSKTDNVICSYLQEGDCSKIKEYISSDKNIYLEEKLKVECYGLDTTGEKYFILTGFDKNSTPKQKKILILNSLDLKVVFSSKGYGDIISINPKFIDLNGDGEKDIIFELQDEEYGFVEILLHGTGEFKYALKSLTFPLSDLLELGVSFYEIKDLNNDGLMEIRFPVLIDDTNSKDRKTLRNVVYTLQDNEYKLME